MGDPADIGPQYQCDECGVWSPDTTCVQCGAELGEANKGVPVVFAKNVIAEGVVMPRVNGGTPDEPWMVVGMKYNASNVEEPRGLFVTYTLSNGQQFGPYPVHTETKDLDGALCIGLSLGAPTLDKLNGAALDDYASMCGYPTRRAPKKDGNQ